MWPDWSVLRSGIKSRLVRLGVGVFIELSGKWQKAFVNTGLIRGIGRYLEELVIGFKGFGEAIL